MREILFRGKRLDTDKWVEGFLTKGKSWKTGGLMPHIMSDYDGRLVLNEINPSSVGQFTGYELQKDPLLETGENGTQKLFEGDNVDFADFDDNGADRPRQGTVYWCDGAFWIDCTEKYGDEAIYSLAWAYAQDDCMRIAGNIHDK